jgi:arginyl-tRNA synthetase
MSSSVLGELKVRFKDACVAAFGSEYQDIDPSVSVAKDLRFGDYQCNAALSLSKRLKQKPQAIATQIIEHLIKDLTYADLGETPTIDGPGFINIKLKPSFLQSKLREINSDRRLGIPPTIKPQRIIVDFSSPNIAKEMHVGHLRSTIIGDCIARILEFQGHDVLRLNHVGDWGTQFGMLITYLKEVYPKALTESNALDLGDLVELYRAAKKRFDEDIEFKEASRLAVVDLQSGQAEATFCWKLLCDQSRREFQKIYDALDIEITERGESFYSPYLGAVVEDLKSLGLLEKSEGALCVFLDGFTNKEGDRQPLIIQKSDGGYNYATTDLAAIRYRIKEDKAERIIYVTDMGQSSHFEQVFQVARRANWLTESTKVTHVPFGLVLGEDGKKLKTRSGDTVRLQDLLDEAIARVKTDLEVRNPDYDGTYKQEVALAVGLGAVKYADLSQNRTSNYAFSFDKMLSLQGNTAPYMLYAYVRIRGISRKGEIDFEGLSIAPAINLNHELELALAKHLIQLPEILDAVSEDLMPNRLCQYLFELSQKFNQFYDQCPVLQAETSDRLSRLVICHITAKTLKLGLNLLGIQVLEKM